MQTHTTMLHDVNDCGDPGINWDRHTMNPARYTWREVSVPTLLFMSLFIGLFLALEPGRVTFHSIADWVRGSVSSLMTIRISW